MAGIVDLVIVIVIGIVAIEFLPQLISGLNIPQLGGGGAQDQSEQDQSEQPQQQQRRNRNRGRKNRGANGGGNLGAIKEQGNDPNDCPAEIRSCCQAGFNRGNNLKSYEIKNCQKCGNFECGGGGGKKKKGGKGGGGGKGGKYKGKKGKKGNFGIAYYGEDDDEYFGYEGEFEDDYYAYAVGAGTGALRPPRPGGAPGGRPGFPPGRVGGFRPRPGGGPFRPGPTIRPGTFNRFRPIRRRLPFTFFGGLPINNISVNDCIAAGADPQCCLEARQVFGRNIFPFEVENCINCGTPQPCF